MALNLNFSLNVIYGRCVCELLLRIGTGVERIIVIFAKN